MPIRRTGAICLSMLLAAWMLTEGVVRSDEPNLILQASFEEPRALDGWAPQQPPGTSVRVDTSVGHSGKSSVLIETQPGSEKESYPAIKFGIVPKPGERYAAEVWLKSECQNELGGFIVFETTQGGQRF